MLVHGLKIALLAAALVAPAAQARNLVPIQDHENLAVATGSGKPATAEQVRAAFIIGGGKMRRPWAFSSAAPDRLIGTLIVRGKHRIEIEVTYSAERYSVKFKSSEGMNQEGSNIHPSYNSWVNDLLQQVRVQLTLL